MQLEPAKIAKKIGIAVLNWPGNCYGIACKMVEKGIVKGTPVYGHWLGPVSEHAPVFGGRAGQGFQRHGWILLADGTVIDPTRWVFEGTAPYIYHGPSDHYDEGGNGVRRMMLREPPDYNPEKRLKLKLSQEAAEHCLDLLGKEGFCVEQVHWLANVPYDMLGDHVWEIYQAIMGSLSYARAWIPIDNRERAEREFG